MIIIICSLISKCIPGLKNCCSGLTNCFRNCFSHYSSCCLNKYSDITTFVKKSKEKYVNRKKTKGDYSSKFDDTEKIDVDDITNV